MFRPSDYKNLLLPTNAEMFLKTFGYVDVYDGWWESPYPGDTAHKTNLEKFREVFGGIDISELTDEWAVAKYVAPVTESAAKKAQYIEVGGHAVVIIG